MHEHVSERDIDRLLDHEAPEAERNRLETRIAECETCTAEWHEVLGVHRTLLQRRELPPTRLIDQQLASVRSARVARRARPYVWGGRVAALLLAATLGLIAGRMTLTTPVRATDGGDAYLLLLSGSQASRLPVEDQRNIGRAFSSWTDSLSRSGQLDGQAQLQRQTVSIVAADSVTADPAMTRALSGVEGFFLIRARDDADAVAIARSSPYLRFGGSIVVRKRYRAP